MKGLIGLDKQIAWEVEEFKTLEGFDLYKTKHKKQDGWKWFIPKQPLISIATGPHQEKEKNDKRMRGYQKVQLEEQMWNNNTIT